MWGTEYDHEFTHCANTGMVQSNAVLPMGSLLTAKQGGSLEIFKDALSRGNLLKS